MAELTAYIPVDFQDHIADEITGEVLQEGTPLSRRTLGQVETGIVRVTEVAITHCAEIAALQAELKVLKDATLNNMTNNVFVESFANLRSVDIATGVYDPVVRKIYV